MRHTSQYRTIALANVVYADTFTVAELVACKVYK